MHCLIHYLNCYYIYLISAMCSIFCWIYYRVVVKINLYQCQCQCQCQCIAICLKFHQSNILAITLATKAWAPKISAHKEKKTPPPPA